MSNEFQVSNTRYQAAHSLLATRYSLLSRALPALFLLGLLPRIYIFVMVGIARVGWPWQIDYAEGVNINAAYLLSQGHNIYHHNGPDGHFGLAASRENGLVERKAFRQPRSV